jgi:hypothetical protein
MEYNTTRNHLEMREYGRHIQKMVEYLMTIEDREIRNQQARSVIELMGFLNPHLKNVEDFRHMLWDHLFVISDFRLDVDSPYPKPERETYKEKPAPLKYPRRYPKFSHLGKNLELIIDKALKEDNEEKRAGFAHAIAYYMKLAYGTWHKEFVHDDAIRSEMDTLTGGQLEFSNTPYIKQRIQNFDRDDFGPAQRRQMYGSRENQVRDNPRDNRNNNNQRNAGSGNRNDNQNRIALRNNGSNGNAGNRNNNNNGGNRNNNNNNNNNNRNNRNNNFKKRF